MRTLNNQNGNVLIIGLVLTAVIAIGAVAILSRNQTGQKVQQQTNLPGVVDQIKATLVGAVMSPQSWQVIQKRNAKAFAYQPQYPPNDQPPAGGGPTQTTLPLMMQSLDIYLVDSELPYYPATDSRAGFTMQGQPCGTRDMKVAFNPDKGNDNCPFRYNVYLLSHVQHNGVWVDTVRFELLFRPEKSSLVINEKSDRYTFNLVRNVDENNVEATCKSIKGTYDKKTGSCSVELAEEVKCPTGQGYRGSGGTSCVVMKSASKTCTGGQSITGFDQEGNPICATAK